jgi:hypothetical protein
VPTPTVALVVVSECPFPAPVTGPVVNVGAAPVIVIGTAGETISFWSSEPRIILSDTTFHVESVVRGDAASTIIVRAVGGTVEGTTMQVSDGQVVFASGQRSRLFLELTSEGIYRVVAGADGKQDAPPGVTPSNPACALPVARVPATGGRMTEQR